MKVKISLLQRAYQEKEKMKSIKREDIFVNHMTRDLSRLYKELL
jgi:hypothetical protein